MRVEGSLTFNGLIEGRLPAQPDLAPALRAWSAEARATGLALDLEIDGGRFSLLANEEPVSAARLGPRPADRVRSLLAALVGLFGDPMAAGLFSTLRSVEIATGREIQTVYLLRPNGSVDAPERSVEIDTAPPAQPKSRNEMVRVAGVSLLVLAALFGVTSLFVDWGGLLSSLWNRVAPLDPAAIKVDASAFEPWFTVEGPEKGESSATIRLTLKRTGAYPLTDEALDRLHAEAAGRVRTQLALESLARGHVRVDVFDAAGKFRGDATLRIAGLLEAETLTIELPLARDPRPARLVVR